MTEHELVKKFIKQSSSDCIPETPIFSRSCDLVVNSRILKSISFKLHDWKTVIDQARTYEMAVDKQYICMPRPARGFPEKFLDIIKWFGIGLIVYENGKFRLEIKAKLNDTFQPSYEQVRKNIRVSKENNWVERWVGNGG